MSAAVTSVMPAMSFVTVLAAAVIVIIAIIIAKIILSATILFAISWNIFTLVPAILHKIDRLTAGIVLPAMLAPIFTMTRRYTQINRIAHDNGSFNDSGLSVNYWWARREAA